MDLEALARAAPVAAARRLIRQTDRQTLADMVELAAIPAPPFGEAERARWLAGRFERIGLDDVAMDDVGNVLGRLPHDDVRQQTAVLVSAHLDTVFPAETDLRVRKSGRRLLAPGIADNARGVAAMLAIARALRAHTPPLELPVVFVGTVGEEGLGDLRGVKHLFRPGSQWRKAAAFISLDGTGRRRIVHRAIGSRRLRVQIEGPGGHSWADWGIVNPIHALGGAIAGLAAIELPRQPRTTLTVGRIAGGTSVNAIPAEAWLELDLRSDAPAQLAELEAEVRRVLAEAFDQANARRRRATPVLRMAVRVIGDRPAGETPAASELVRIARAVTRLMGEHPELVSSSTDANIPIALGVPAITVGTGGESAGTHTLEEWYVNEGGTAGIERALLIVLAVAGP